LDYDMANNPTFLARDRLLALASTLAAAAAVGVFAWIAVDLVARGAGQLSWNFPTAEVEDAGRSGGIGPILVSTFLILLVCLAVALPLGTACAAWLSEFANPAGRLTRLVRAGVDLLASVPSIVFGLFGMVFFCQTLGLGFSLTAGGLTLACMVLPITIATAHAGFRAVPDEVRQAAAACGMSKSATLWHLLLPGAMPGVAAGLTLGTGRAAAETAALLFTSGYATRWPEGLGDSGRALSVHIYDLAMNVPGGAPKAAASALVLLVFLFVIHAIASALTERCLRGTSRT